MFYQTGDGLRSLRLKPPVLAARQSHTPHEPASRSGPDSKSHMI
jgi:hypothetical protein